MSAYNAALFVHVLGVIALFVAIGIQQWGGAQVRRADTLEHLRLWLRLMGASQRIYPPSIALLLAGGLFMAGTTWSFTTPWIVVALVGLAAMIVLGILVVGRRFTAIEAAASADGPEGRGGSSGSGPIPPGAARLIARPGMWSCLFALNGTAVGILWLMTNKPGWTASIAVVAVMAAAAGAAGARAARANPKDHGTVEQVTGGTS